jgi:uncharacterized protein (DUF1778 family)
MKSFDKLTLRFRDAKELELIRKAAESQDRSLNYFIVTAARAMAEQVLRQSRSNGQRPRKLRTPVSR